uniref:Uncharacterized protein n=1 Tax=Arundo donax TaxID=35708 RepID=A0A0A9DPY5_ARUDO
MRRNARSPLLVRSSKPPPPPMTSLQHRRRPAADTEAAARVPLRCPVGPPLLLSPYVGVTAPRLPAPRRFRAAFPAAPPPPVQQLGQEGWEQRLSSLSRYPTASLPG